MTNAKWLAGAVSGHRDPLPLSLLLLAAALLSLLLPATHGLVLQHSYPTPGQYNLVQLDCTDEFAMATDATFHLSRGGTGREEEIGGSEGAILYTVSPETEGELRCKSNGATSNSIALAAQPAEWFDCATNGQDSSSFQYQLKEYSQHDRYVFNCTISPGAMRNSLYTLQWRSRVGSTVSPHDNWNPATFAVELTSSDLSWLSRETKWLECRVEITHAPGDSATYCGHAIRAAVKANITKHLESRAVKPDQPFNFSCSATGSELQFTWRYGNDLFTSADRCHDGVCVSDRWSPDEPLRRTSVLVVSEGEGAGSRIEVQCLVSQNLSTKFRAPQLVSRAVVTVASSDTETDPSPTTDDDPPSTNDVETTSSSAPILTPLHITLIILVAPITAVILLVILLVYCYKRRNCEREVTSDRSKNSEEEETIFIEEGRYVPLPTARATVSGTNRLSSVDHETDRAREETDGAVEMTSDLSLFRSRPHFPQFLRGFLPGSNGRLQRFIMSFVHAAMDPRRSFLPLHTIDGALSQYRAKVFPEKVVWCRDGRGSPRECETFVSECVVIDMESGSRRKICSARPLPSNTTQPEVPPTLQATNPVVMLPGCDEDESPETRGDATEDQREQSGTTERPEEATTATDAIRETQQSDYEDQTEPSETTSETKEPELSENEPNNSTT